MLTGSTSTVFINEIHYDNNGPQDLNEGIEIANTSNTDLTGWKLVLYSDGTQYSTINLSGSSAFTFLSIPGLENGPRDGMALVNASGVVVQLLSYEGVFTASNGPANGLTSTDIGVLERGTDTAGNSLQLVGTGSTYGDFTWAAPALSTSSAQNTGQTVVFPEISTTGTKFADNILGSDGGRDIIIAMSGNDVVNGRGGNDFILGNKGDDTLNGGNGNDELYGGTQNDTIHGGNGDDRIYGDQNDDQLFGDGGADAFVFNHKAFGHDIIHDFENGIDHLEFGRKNFTNFADVQAAAVQHGADLVITDARGNSLTILNFTLAQLTSDDVIFI